MTVDRAGVAAIQDKVRQLLVELDRVTTQAGVPVFLAYGSAIGAVRDGDLIPWDVDADVWLPHEHYAAFVEDAVPLLGPDYELLTAETHDDYEYLFPRLVFRDIHHVYVRVDVFPLDPAPGGRRRAAAYVKGMHLLDRLFFVKRARTDVRAHYSPAKRLVTRALRVASAPLPSGVLLRIFRRLQAMGDPASTYVANSCGSYGPREVFERAWFAEATTEQVFGHPLPLPASYDAVLAQVYGDYLTPVSADRQHDELVHATATFVEPMRAQGLLPSGAEEAS